MADKQPDQAASNSLGLDLAALKIKDSPDPAEPKPSADAQNAAPNDGAAKPSEPAEVAQDAEQADTGDDKKESKEKKKPYVNPDRVKTGGAQRVRLTCSN